ARACRTERAGGGRRNVPAAAPVTVEVRSGSERGSSAAGADRLPLGVENSAGHQPELGGDAGDVVPEKLDGGPEPARAGAGLLGPLEDLRHREQVADGAARADFVRLAQGPVAEGQVGVERPRRPG